MKKSDELKQKIADVESRLDAALAEARDLPIQAGELAAAGDESRADKLFQQAEKASMLASRHSATLAALKKQLDDAMEVERRAENEAKAKELEADIETTSKKLQKALEDLAVAWNRVLEVKPESFSISGLKGEILLSRAFRRQILGGDGATGSYVPAGRMEGELMNYLQITVDRYRVEAQKVARGE